MSVTAKAIVTAKYAEDSSTTQYTARSVNTIIDKFTATNVTAGSETLSVYIGGGSDAFLIVKLKSLAPSETYTFPELVGQIVNSSEIIKTIASAASSIVIRVSGREITL